MFVISVFLNKIEVKVPSIFIFMVSNSLQVTYSLWGNIAVLMIISFFSPVD